jgi:hypothetical protein
MFLAADATLVIVRNCSLFAPLFVLPSFWDSIVSPPFLFGAQAWGRCPLKS